MSNWFVGRIKKNLLSCQREDDHNLKEIFKEALH